MKPLEDRTAIVTGAGTPDGIGRATARLFAERGARVAILDLAETDPLGAAAEVGPGHPGYVCDVRDQAACSATVDVIAERFGRIDVLIGNAGIVELTSAGWSSGANAATQAATFDVALRHPLLLFQCTTTASIRRRPTCLSRTCSEAAVRSA